MKPSLVIIHKDNSSDKISELESRYGGGSEDGGGSGDSKDSKRFSRIYHLVPGSENEGGKSTSAHQQNKKPYILPVDGSYDHHQSFIAKGLSSYYSEDSPHYIFITAEHALAQEVNENNYQQKFGIDSNAAYIASITNIDNAYSLLPWKYNVFYHLQQKHQAGTTNEPAQDENNKAPNNASNKASNKASIAAYLKAALTSNKQWQHSVDAYNFSLNTPNIKWPAQLTNHIEAMQRFKHNNLSLDNLDIKRAVRRHKKGIIAKHPAIKKSMMLRAIIEYWVRRKDSYRPYKLAYPLARGTTDIVIIPKSAIKRFATHCEIFTAYKLPHQIAIPTAAILTTKQIKQQGQTNIPKQPNNKHL